MKNRDKSLLEKAEKILKGNIYHEVGKYPWGQYRMIAPSRYPGFKGIWNWDSAFHAIGMISIDIELAKEQILGFLQFQKENGFLPDVIRENGTIEDRIGKPPVMAWASLRVYEASRDNEFLQTVYEALVKNEDFWVKERMQGGLFHYDAERRDDCDDEEYRICVSWESGWDEHPRWDQEPQNIWPVDLNSYMVMTYDALTLMARHLGFNDIQWIEKSKMLKNLIDEVLWDEKRGSYLDYNFKTQSFLTILSPASFMPLFVGFASKERAEKMNNIAKKHFMPCMPMVAFDDPKFDVTAYCRGACWLHMAYMAAKGLKDYGFDDTADTIKNTILNWVHNDGDMIHENYNSLTGEGKCNAYFSWSCVFVREFILNFERSTLNE